MPDFRSSARRSLRSPTKRRTPREKADLGPLHFRWQRGEDRVHIAAGLQAKRRAAVVEQVEFHIAAAAHELLLALLLVPGGLEIPPHECGINLEEGKPHLADESEIGPPVAGIQIVEENSADAARLVPMLEEEILVAPR